MMRLFLRLTLVVAATLPLTACNDVVYRAPDVVSGMKADDHGADVARLERLAAAGDEAARYDLAQYYISKGRYQDAEKLGVIIDPYDQRKRTPRGDTAP
jgi:hypothetical protein